MTFFTRRVPSPFVTLASPPPSPPRRSLVTHASPPSSTLHPGIKCYFVGAGLGGVDYLTIRAFNLLQSAHDMDIIYDDLGATQDILALLPSSARKHYVGKRGGKSDSVPQREIDDLLSHLLRQGKRVIRLKGGCPSTFSRISSELAAVKSVLPSQSHEASYEIIPGISSALAAPLLAGFPLTDKLLSTSYTVASAHDMSVLDWSLMAKLDTLVLLMGGRNLPKIVDALLEQGRDGSTPIAVIRQAGFPPSSSNSSSSEAQQVWRGSLGTIVSQCAGQSLSPCILVIGQVANFRQSLSNPPLV